MSSYNIIRVLRQFGNTSNCLGCNILKSSALNLILKQRHDYFRPFSSLPNIEIKSKPHKYDEVKTTINTLLLDNSDSKKKNTLLALQYCGRSSPNLTITQRNDLTKEIYKSLKDFSDLSVFHAYIQICIDNDESINYVNFFNTMKVEPNIETFKLMLESVCNVGDKNSALNILEVMKKGSHPADVDVFNLLVLGYSINGGYSEAKSVLEMMKLARMKTTDLTNWNILRGVATFNKASEFSTFLENHQSSIEFNPDLFLDVVYRLGKQDSLQNIKKFISKFEVPRQVSANIIDLCVQFIVSGKPNIAFEIYCLLIEPNDETYGMPILEEMINFQTPTEIVINLTKGFMSRNLNPEILRLITEFALRDKYFETAIALLKEHDHLKPHYFWPLLIHKSKQNGQIGVFDVIKTMQSLKTPVDTDTLYFYVIPNCDLSEPKLLINHFKQCNFTVKEVFTPILTSLLLRNNVKSCMELFKDYDVSVDGQRLIKPLILFYKKSRNFDTTLMILQKICETNVDATDWTGILLLQIMKGPKINSDFDDYLEFLKILKNSMLTITTTYLDNIWTYLEERPRDVIVMKHIRIALENLVDTTKQEINYIEHPRNMKLNDLECHFIELTEKQMDTKGVLKRLIQEHSRSGNHERLMELQDIYKNSGYSESAGMKGSILNNLIMLEKLDEALNVYNEMKKEFPTFNVDLFKIINLATLLVKRDQFNEAMDLLRSEVNPRYDASPAIDRNCWKLLSSCQTAEKVDVMFKFLIENKICKVSNVILGPLVKIHLHSDDLVAAVAVYKECVEKYRCTPLQLELMTKIVQNKDSKECLKQVLALTASIHGTAPARLSLLAALAANGFEKPLSKFLMENEPIPAKLVQARCDRWITENKLSALLTLMRSIERLPDSIMNKSIVQNAILKYYTAQQDCDSALQFYEDLRSNEREINDQFNKNLLALLKRYKYNIPSSLRL